MVRTGFAQALVDRYRCPEEFASCRLRGHLSETAGFFRFGSGITCYGRSSSGTRARRVQPLLYDAGNDALVENSELFLPFDPTEIVDNLLWERYVPRDSRIRRFAKGAYYSLRPFLSNAARKRIQRMQLKNWMTLPFPRWPVDTTVEDICEKVMSLSMGAHCVDRVPFIWFWPDGARSCVLMTHDVETELGRDFCPTLMDIDDAFGVKAAFQIVPEERYEVPGELLATIRDRGFEVAVQDLNHDGRLFDDREEFLRRVERINHYGREYGATGFRAGVLYRRPEWLSALELSVDMSIPNVAHLDPQRGGCCTVLPYFIGEVLELPVTATQDYMLLELLKDASIDLWKTQLDLIIGKNGLASFIVHPDYVVQAEARSIYETLLGHLRDMGSKHHIWFALPSAINRWWRARSRMQMVADGNSWRIEGEGAEHAVLAYARPTGDGLVYDLQMADA